MQLIDILKINLERCNRWHKGGINEWDINHWMVATLGELGEAANIVKKRNRVIMGASSINEPGRHITDLEQADAQILEEFADTFFYLTLMAISRMGVEEFYQDITYRCFSISKHKVDDYSLLQFINYCADYWYIYNMGHEKTPIKEIGINRWVLRTAAELSNVAIQIEQGNDHINFFNVLACLFIAASAIATPEQIEFAVIKKFNDVSEKYGFPERLNIGDYVTPPGNGIH